MITTAKKAGGYFCPFTFNNRLSNNDGDLVCCGPDCMAWKWFTNPTDEREREGYCQLIDKTS